MRQGPALVAGVLVLVGIATATSLNARADALPEGSSATGMVVFHFECASCHGEAAQGTVDGPALVGPEAPLADLTPEEIARRVSEGGSDMRPIVVSDHDIADAIAYLREIQEFGGI